MSKEWGKEDREEELEKDYIQRKEGGAGKISQKEKQGKDYLPGRRVGITE